MSRRRNTAQRTCHAAIWALVCTFTCNAYAAVTVDSVAIPVTDMQRATTFYRDVLHFERVADREVTGTGYEHLFGVFGSRIHAVRMQLGTEFIELVEFVAPRGRPAPVDSKSNDHWFQHIAIIVNDIDRAYQHLRAHHVQHASTGPQRLPDWNPNAGGISAFYFRDSEGNYLEVLSFPPGKGKARWQRSGDELFLGIDHTAIVVADTDSSLTYYRDILGMKVAGASENWGEEQERLNNVFGARLRITGLEAEAGFGVELLEYLAPRTGRPYPQDSATNDAWSWLIQFATPDVVTLGTTLRTGRVRWVSSGVIALPDSTLGYNNAVLVRDPDGHANLIRQTTGQTQ